MKFNDNFLNPVQGMCHLSVVPGFVTQLQCIRMYLCTTDDILYVVPVYANNNTCVYHVPCACLRFAHAKNCQQKDIISSSRTPSGCRFSFTSLHWIFKTVSFSMERGDRNEHFSSMLFIFLVLRFDSHWTKRKWNEKMVIFDVKFLRQYWEISGSILFILAREQCYKNLNQAGKRCQKYNFETLIYVTLPNLMAVLVVWLTPFSLTSHNSSLQRKQNMLGLACKTENK